MQLRQEDRCRAGRSSLRGRARLLLKSVSLKPVKDKNKYKEYREEERGEKSARASHEHICDDCVYVSIIVRPSTHNAQSALLWTFASRVVSRVAGRD